MEPAQEASAGGPAAVSNNKFLTFTLGKEEYGIDILRGIIVPIVDMRIKFNLGKAEYNQFTVVIDSQSRQPVAAKHETAAPAKTLAPAHRRFPGKTGRKRNGQGFRQGGSLILYSEEK